MTDVRRMAATDRPAAAAAAANCDDGRMRVGRLDAGPAAL